jgi:hypothetical protein
MNEILNYRKNFYSQNGEDGVLKYILNRLTENNVNLNKQCVEFGAWDGKFCSNVFNLIKTHKWLGILIEMDKVKYKKLKKLETKFNVKSLNKKIEITGKNSIDKILENTELKKDFDILSIDIDSYDADVWQSLSYYIPKIVIIEIDNSIKPGKLVKGNLQNNGSSFSYVLDIALKKNYFLLCDIGNLIFINKKFLDFFKIKKEFLVNPTLLYNDSWSEGKRIGTSLNLHLKYPFLYQIYLRYFKKFKNYE